MMMASRFSACTDHVKRSVPRPGPGPLCLPVVHREPPLGTHANKHVFTCFRSRPLDVPVPRLNPEVSMSEWSTIAFEICGLDGDDRPLDAHILVWRLFRLRT